MRSYYIQQETQSSYHFFELWRIPKSVILVFMRYVKVMKWTSEQNDAKNLKFYLFLLQHSFLEQSRFYLKYKILLRFKKIAFLWIFFMLCVLTLKWLIYKLSIKVIYKITNSTQSDIRISCIWSMTSEQKANKFWYIIKYYKN